MEKLNEVLAWLREQPQGHYRDHTIALIESAIECWSHHDHEQVYNELTTNFNKAKYELDIANSSLISKKNDIDIELTAAKKYNATKVQLSEITKNWTPEEEIAYNEYFAKVEKLKSDYLTAGEAIC